jgi:hypothetical protein
MKVTKEKSDFGTNIFVEQDHKYVSFTYGRNEDLYWSIHNRKGIDGLKHDSFTITKENYGIYHLFEELYRDIETIHIHEYTEDDIPFGLEDDEKEEYLREFEEREEENRVRCREENRSHYNELFNPEEQTITWYSDETASEVSNILRIKKEEESFKLDFIVQPYIEGYSKDNYSDFYIPVRISNSGSKYDPFNIVFMRMYEKLKEVDDVKDIGHQIHIDEILYDLDHKLVKKVS